MTCAATCTVISPPLMVSDRPPADAAQSMPGLAAGMAALGRAPGTSTAATVLDPGFGSRGNTTRLEVCSL